MRLKTWEMPIVHPAVRLPDDRRRRRLRPPMLRQLRFQYNQNQLVPRRPRRRPLRHSPSKPNTSQSIPTETSSAPSATTVLHLQRGQVDSAGDLVGDLCDNCPWVSNPVRPITTAIISAMPATTVRCPELRSAAADSDGIGDLCDPDDDGDLVPTVRTAPSRRIHLVGSCPATEAIFVPDQMASSPGAAFTTRLRDSRLRPRQVRGPVEHSSIVPRLRHDLDDGAGQRRTAGTGRLPLLPRPREERLRRHHRDRLRGRPKERSRLPVEEKVTRRLN